MASIDPYTEGFLRGLEPPPILTVSQWADRNRILSSVSSPNPGPWRTSKTPYLREPMDCLSSHSLIEIVDMMFGSQLGKTEAILNWMGYKIDHSPGPMMGVQPTVDMAKRFSKQRIATLSETAAIREKLRPARERDSGNTILQKDFPGGTLILTGANSPVGLSSAPVENLALDEEDRYPDATEEGDPVELAEARTKNFPNRKICRTSTPTTSSKSRIYKGFLEGDQSYYHVPCPQCHKLQVLEWGGPDLNHGIKWEKDDPENVWYVCKHNGCIIYEYQKPWMMAEENGACWIATYPERSHYHRSFQLSTIYSPWFDWKKAVRLFLKTKNSPERLRAFVNTYLGEPWQEKDGEVPDWRMLYGRREAWKIGVVPQSGLMLTAGLDVQKDRVEALVRAWGEGKRSWVVDKLVFPGDTSDLSQQGVWWAQVAPFLRKLYPHESGKMLPLRMAAIDAGFNSQIVYSFVREFPRDRVIATRGFDHLKMIIGSPVAVDVTQSGKKIRRGLYYYPIGSSMSKSELYALLRMLMPTERELEESGFPEGFIHFPEFDEDFFLELTAEHLTFKLEKGFRKYFWEKIRERNEVLDMMVLSRAAASLCGIDRWEPEDWSTLAGELQPIQTNEEIEGTGGETPRRKSNFW